MILSDEAGERKLYETVEKLKVYQTSKLSDFYTALLFTPNVPFPDSVNISSFPLLTNSILT